MARGATARRNRQAKRAATRAKGAGVLLDTEALRDAVGFTPEDEIAALAERAAAGTFAATGSTDLPLTDRDTPWDSGAARRSLTEAQYPRAHFWRDPEGDPKTLAAYKLIFAVNSPPLTAVWRGVTACAGVMQGARGGVDIPEADRAAVRRKIEAVYAKARKVYGDDTIQVPWADGEAKGDGLDWLRALGADAPELAAQRLAHAEVGLDGGDLEYAERWATWAWALGATAGMFGRDGTGVDLEEFTHSTRCSCGHPLAEHAGIGACGHVDGRGSCSCGEFNEVPLVAVGIEADAEVEFGNNESATGLEPSFWPDGDRFVIRFADGQLATVTRVTDEAVSAEGQTLVYAQVADAAADAFQAAPAPGDQCACGHDAQVHAGDTMDGACSAPGCDCQAYEAADEPAPVEASALAPALADSSTLIHPGEPPLYRRVAFAFDAPAEVAMPPTEADPEAGMRWTATLCPEGTPTDDGRAFAPDSLTWRDLPLPIGRMLDTPHADVVTEAPVCARMDHVWREGNLIRADGVFAGNDLGRETARMVDARELRGISVDVAVRAYEVGPLSDYVDADGRWVGTTAAAADGEQDAPDMVDVVYGDAPMLLVVTDGVIGSACHSADTEVLTENGWKRFPELKRGDKVATRNQLTKAIEYHEPTYFHAERWNGKMLRFSNSRNLDLLVTPNHRMLVQRRNGDEVLMRADELATKTRGTLGIPLVAGWHDEEIDEFVIEHDQIPSGMCACGCGNPTRTRVRWERGGHGPGTIAKTLPGHGHGLNTEPLSFDGTDFAAFMGMWLAEGSIVRNRPGAIFISQMEQSRGFVAYRDLLTRMFGFAKHDGKCFVIKNARLWRYLRQFGKAPDKYVSPELKKLGRRQLQVLLDYYLLGDGSSRSVTAYTVSQRLADDLQEIAQKLGMWARIRTREHTDDTRMRDGRIIRAANKKLQRIVSFRNPSLAQRSNRASWLWDVQEVDYAGMVYCVSVPNEVFYVRRNGLPAWSGNTICPFPAFAEAQIALTAAAAPAVWTWRQQLDMTITGNPAALAASAAAEPVDLGEYRHPQAPFEFHVVRERTALYASGLPVDAFADPCLEGPTPVTVTDDGRVYGHAAIFGTCHIGISGSCVTPPESRSGYAYFHLGEFVCDDGQRVAVGKVTIDTGHAAAHLGRAAAASHYDDTGSVAAYVVAGEDDHGIWVAGTVAPGLDDATLAKLRGSVLSGDWRAVNGYLELVALLAVNVPGFPVPRAPKAMIAAAGGAEQVLSLVAAGICRPQDVAAARIRDLAARASGEMARLAARAGR